MQYSMSVGRTVDWLELNMSLSLCTELISSFDQHFFCHTTSLPLLWYLPTSHTFLLPPSISPIWRQNFTACHPCPVSRWARAVLPGLRWLNRVRLKVGLAARPSPCQRAGWVRPVANQSLTRRQWRGVSLTRQVRSEAAVDCPISMSPWPAIFLLFFSLWFSFRGPSSSQQEALCDQMSTNPLQHIAGLITTRCSVLLLLASSSIICD